MKRVISRMSANAGQCCFAQRWIHVNSVVPDSSSTARENISSNVRTNCFPSRTLKTRYPRFLLRRCSCLRATSTSAFLMRCATLRAAMCCWDGSGLVGGGFDITGAPWTRRAWTRLISLSKHSFHMAHQPYRDCPPGERWQWRARSRTLGRHALSVSASQTEADAGFCWSPQHDVDYRPCRIVGAGRGNTLSR